MLISFTTFEISSQRQCTFNSHQNNKIFNQQFSFLSNLLFSLDKNKMIQSTSQSTIIDITAEEKEQFKIFEYFRYEIVPKGILFLQKAHCSVEAEKQFLSR